MFVWWAPRCMCVCLHQQTTSDVSPTSVDRVTSFLIVSTRTHYSLVVVVCCCNSKPHLMNKWNQGKMYTEDRRKRKHWLENKTVDMVTCFVSPFYGNAKCYDKVREDEQQTASERAHCQNSKQTFEKSSVFFSLGCLSATTEQATDFLFHS